MLPIKVCLEGACRAPTALWFAGRAGCRLLPVKGIHFEVLFGLLLGVATIVALGWGALRVGHAARFVKGGAQGLACTHMQAGVRAIAAGRQAG